MKLSAEQGAALFQFQSGTIKGWLLHSMHNPHFSFNSNLVQLRVFLAASLCIILASFNSNLVQLRDNMPNILCSQEGCFNSNLVQLRDNCPDHTASTLCTFQFQSGTIKGFASSARLLKSMCFNSNLVQLRELYNWSFS